MIKKLGATTLIAVFALTGCSAPTAASGYTGNAVVQDTHQGSRKHGCDLLVSMTGKKEQAWIRVGRRTKCDGYQHGSVVRLVNGELQK